jgi:N6-adenosine-specific RNA methylase IME4
LATLKRGDNQHSPIGETSQAKAAALLNVGKRSVERAREVQEQGAPELVQAVERGTVSVSAAADIATLPRNEQGDIVARGTKEILRVALELRAKDREARRAKRIAQIAEIAKSTPALPHGRFPIIYADAPWKMNLDEIGSLKSFEAHYPTMDLAEIAALPVADIATPDAALFLWSIPAMLPEALEVMSAWGFTYVSQIVWVKDKIGLGYWVRYQHELLLIGRRGNIPTPPERERPPSVINAPRREHSRKPDEAYELIERMYPELPKIELFARQTRAGWAAWGNEIAREAADFRSANRRGSASSAPAAAPG